MYTLLLGVGFEPCAMYATGHLPRLSDCLELGQDIGSNVTLYMQQNHPQATLVYSFKFCASISGNRHIIVCVCVYVGRGFPVIQKGCIAHGQVSPWRTNAFNTECVDRDAPHMGIYLS